LTTFRFVISTPVENGESSTVRYRITKLKLVKR